MRVRPSSPALPLLAILCLFCAATLPADAGTLKAPTVELRKIPRGDWHSWRAEWPRQRMAYEQWTSDSDTMYTGVADTAASCLYLVEFDHGGEGVKARLRGLERPGDRPVKGGWREMRATSERSGAGVPVHRASWPEHGFSYSQHVESMDVVRLVFHDERRGVRYEVVYDAAYETVSCTRRD